MNKDKLIFLVHKWTKQRNVPFNTVLWNFFVENLITEICRDEYFDNFIIKGGVLMSNMVGLERRSTVDLDFQIRNFNIEDIETKLSYIFDNPINPKIKYSILKRTNIKKDDEYGGYKIMILCQIENIKTFVSIDFAPVELLRLRFKNTIM